MGAQQKIVKVGLAAMVDRQILLVRKRGSHAFILPGGKPEKGEGQLETLQRELNEELGCSIDGALYLASFSDWAADHVRTEVTVHLFCGHINGLPTPAAEIEELKWLSLDDAAGVPLAPSLTNHILPYLRTLYPDGKFSEKSCATGG
jgi:8-oxo-dGTP diphosphatase